MTIRKTVDEMEVIGNVELALDREDYLWQLRSYKDCLERRRRYIKYVFEQKNLI